jgi:hypothetical protein
VATDGRPKPEFKLQPKYRYFGLVRTNTKVKTKRQRVTKLKSLTKIEIVCLEGFLLVKQKLFF